MIVKNKLPENTDDVMLIVKDYYDPKVIRLLVAWHGAYWRYNGVPTGENLTKIDEYVPPFGRIIGWSKINNDI